MLMSIAQSIRIYLQIPFGISEKGQDLSEYGLLVGFIAIVILAAVTLFGQQLSTFWNSLATEISNHL